MDQKVKRVEYRLFNYKRHTYINYNFESRIPFKKDFLKTMLAYMKKCHLKMDYFEQTFIKNLKEYSKLSKKEKENNNLEELFLMASKSFLKGDRVHMDHYLRSFLYPQFACCVSLQECLGKRKGISFYKQMMDTMAEQRKHPKMKKVSENLFTFDPPEACYLESFDILEFTIGPNIASQEVYRCRWHEVLKNLNNPQVAYAVACHGDFQRAKCSNRNFELKRTKTLMMGKDCCDLIWYMRKR